jgi:flagellar hook-basal body complex protein FliE
MNVADALAAYSKGNGGGASLASSVADSGGGESFSSTLKGFVGDAVKSLETGEKAAAAGAVGKADIASVVTAINNAEMMLQTVVTIRDKVLAAYQDITKTSI